MNVHLTKSEVLLILEGLDALREVTKVDKESSQEQVANMLAEIAQLERVLKGGGRVKHTQ